MILRFHAAVRAALTDTLLRVYALEPAAIPSIVLEAPPTRAMGDLACPVAFELARRLRKAPRAIAAEIVAALGPIPGISQAVAAPNGYVNVFLDRAAAVRLALGVADDGAPAPEPLLPAEKTIVEHTAINPNKAAHIGHLRNATLGDTLVRLLRYGGVPVEVQNYIDDTGVQVADVVVGFRAPRGQDARRGARDRRLDALRLLLLGSLRPRHRVVRRGPRAAVGAQRDAARDRARRQRHRGARGVRRRSHRARPTSRRWRG